MPVVLLLTVLLCVTALFAACKCQHDYERQETKTPSCGEMGEATYTCTKCGDSYVEELPKTGEHSFTVYRILGGKHWQKCENCDETTEKTDHVFNTTVSSEQSTCTKQGSIVKSCVCGATDTETLPLANHNYTVPQKDGALHWQKCENCDAITEKTEHEFTVQGVIVPSTCTVQGSDTKSCACGATSTQALPLAQHAYTKTEYDADNHWLVCSECDAENPNQARVPHSLKTETTNPSCEKEGKTVTVCEVCGYSHTETLPALKHDLDKTAFASASTGSGHYYKCNLCGENIAEPHTLADCDCPDGYNREATCSKAGHQDQQCSVCSWRNHFTTPMTNDHSWSDKWSSNGVFHWHACTNGECTAKNDETQHLFELKSTPADCDTNGLEWRECSSCDRVQDGSYKTILAKGHSYETIEIVTRATCAQEGLEKLICARCGGEEQRVIPKTEHNMSQYESNIDGHYRKCADCGFTQTTIRNHTWSEDVKSEPTCTQNGLTVRTCEFCKFTYNQTTTRNHAFVTVADSYVDSTCTEYGTHVEVCNYCKLTRTVVDEHLGLVEHKVVEFPEKEMTETEAGNRRYWQCTVCLKYFTSHGCVEELDEKDVFVYPPKIVVVESIEALLELASSCQIGEESYDYYQITASVYSVDSMGSEMILDDGTPIFVITLVNENLKTIKEHDVVTLKGKLTRTPEKDTKLINCKIISVENDGNEKCSLFFRETLNSSDIKVYTYALDESGGNYKSNTNNYKCLKLGEKLTFYFSDIKRNAFLQKVILNGKSCTASDGVLEITVTEDIDIEFVFGNHNYSSVTLRSIDTSNNNGNAIAVDEYISYAYTGSYNKDGRLHANSHLIFKSVNANITGIVITYDADYLSNNPDMVQNTLNAKGSGDANVKIEQGSANKNGKVVLSFNVSDGYTSLDYFTDVCQARVVEITINYQTSNTFAEY